MFIVCLVPSSTQAERGLADMQRALFARTGSPAFFALPPHSVVVVSKRQPDATVLDDLRVDRSREKESAKESGNHHETGEIELDAESGQVFYRPFPASSLEKSWTETLYACTENQIEPAQQLEPPLPQSRPAIYLGSTPPADLSVTQVVAEMNSFSWNTGAIRTYKLTVIQISYSGHRRWWEQLRWEILYEREFGHHRLR